MSFVKLPCALLGLLLLASLASAARIPGPITFVSSNPVTTLAIVLPNTIDGVLNNSNWQVLPNCVNNIGRLAWSVQLRANMTGVDGNKYADVNTFAAIYNSNGKLAGHLHVTLSNMSYDYADKAVYWINIPQSSGDVLFDFPTEMWIQALHLEPVANLCNGQGMPKTYQGAGDMYLLNHIGYGATALRFPYNKSDAYDINFGHPPTGDHCIPFMGCHWFLRTAGAPKFPQWVAGFDVYGELQFTEVMTTFEQPLYGMQWELVPAGAIPDFGNVNWYFRHVHVKDFTEGCANVCAQNRDDCHPSALCTPDFNQAPYYRCTCPTNDTSIVTFNNGRGPSGCSTCPVGKIPSPDRRLCVDACPAGYLANSVTGACEDIDDCVMAGCASDEVCVNLKGTPAACIYTQVSNLVGAWKDKVAGANATDLLAVLDTTNLRIATIAFTKRAALVIKLTSTGGITQTDAAIKFTTWAGQTVNAVLDPDTNVLTLTVPQSQEISINDESSAALAAASGALVALASALAL